MIERHPLKPFLPENAKVLFLGSFPPPKKRWCMEPQQGRRLPLKSVIISISMIYLRQILKLH